MEMLVDIGETQIAKGYGFHVQARLDPDNNLVILLMQDYFDEVSQYRLDFGEILYCEYIDEHITAPRFKGNNLLEGTLFQVENSSLVYELTSELKEVEEVYHYFISSSLYFIEVVSFTPVTIEKVNLNSNATYIL